ncbi:hypothetical protein H4R18_005343, partial [Coemansia javaensis]
AQASTTVWQPAYVEYRPQWAFGFGLGYSTVTCSNVTLSAGELAPGSPVTATVTVTNHGPYAQRETVQMLTRQHYRAGYAPENYRLRAFAKIDLPAGESRTVALQLRAEDLAFWDRDLRRRIEPAPVTVAINPYTYADVSATVQLVADPDVLLNEAGH